MTLDSDQAAFIHAICEQPADDNVRLVYADWLQDHGLDAAAELIRVQVERCELGSRLPCNMFISDMDRLRYLRDRTTALVAELAPRCPACKGQEWAIPCRFCREYQHCPCTFDRGFCVEVRVPSIATVLSVATNHRLVGPRDWVDPTDDGRTLVTEHPLLARVVPVDKEPFHDGRYHLWFRQHPSGAPVIALGHADLPTILFDRLPGQAAGVAAYDTPADALTAASTALADVLRDSVRKTPGANPVNDTSAITND